MSDDQDQPRRGGDAGTERALDELRVALEQLAARMGAGFREDLAQIRAIAASVAERDLTADVEALRVDVATLVGRDSSGELRTELAALRSDLARLASADDVNEGLRTALGPLQVAVDRIGARLDDDSGRTQVLARFEALEARLDQLAGGDGSMDVLARLDALSSRLDALATPDRAGGDSLLEQLQDNLADVASGEVVGALWDEVRQLRTDLPDLLAAPEAVAAPAPEPGPQLAALTDELAVLRTELGEGLVVEPSGALSASLDSLKAEVDSLRTALGDLRATPEPAAAPADDGRHAQLVGHLESIRTSVDAVRSRLDDVEQVAGPQPADRAEVVAIVADEATSLRSFVGAELEGVRRAVGARLDAASEVNADALAAALARPADAMTSALEALRVEVDGLRASLADVAATPDPVHDGHDEVVVEQLGAIRAGLDDVRARLDEGLVVADDAGALAGAGGADIEAVGDQVAALRDFVASELETVRHAVTSRLDAAAEATAATVASAAPREPAAPAEVHASIDAEAIESLRGEIRASGAIGDQVVDALREELKALRRRIAVKAAERVLDDQQLTQIADAVAARLAEGRDPS